MIRQNQEYIIDFKQTSIYKAANFWFDKKRSKYLHILMANSEYSNNKDSPEKIESHETYQSRTPFNILIWYGIKTKTFVSEGK